MVPKISARFRKRNGIPFAIEQLSGKQYRCRHCSSVFLSETELDRHFRSISEPPKSRKKVSRSSPQLSSSVEVRVLYTYDIIDKQKRQWLKLKSGDEYDGL